MATFELVTPQWLASNSHQPALVVIDARSAADYWQGHIPAARHFDPALLALVRTDAGSLARFQALLTWALSSLGISAQSQVVVVGAQNDTPAAKVAWALAYAGVARIALLDGGQAAWQGELAQAAPQWAPVSYTLDPQSAYLATAQDVLAAAQGGGIVLDARTREEFDGQRSNAGRKGRVPNARFWDSRHELGENGLFAPSAAVSGQAAQAGAQPDNPSIVYCGGGGRASRTFLALQLAGHPAAVYPASWLEWGVDTQYPVQEAAPQAAS